MRSASLHEQVPGGLDLWSVVVAVSLGLAVPAAAFGKAMIAGFLVVPVVACLVAARRGEINWQRWDGPLGAAIMVTTVVWLISSIASIDPLKSLTTWSRTLAIVVFGYLLVEYLARRSQSCLICLGTFLLAEAIALVIAVLVTYGEPVTVALVGGLHGEEFDPSRAFKAHGSAAACVLPLVLWAGWALGGWWRLPALLIVPLTVILLYGTGAQLNESGSFGLLGAAALLCLVAVARRLSSAARWLLGLVVAAMLLFVAGYILVQLPSPPVTDGQTAVLPFPDWHRQVIWGFARDAFLEAPVIGVGPNTVNFLPGAHAFVPGLSQEYIPSHPHNWVLEIAVETGIVGILSLFAALLLALRLLVVRALERVGPARTAMAVFAVFWVSSLGNFSIWSAWWLMTLIVSISLPLAAMRMQRDGSPRVNRPSAI